MILLVESPLSLSGHLDSRRSSLSERKLSHSKRASENERSQHQQGLRRGMTDSEVTVHAKDMLALKIDDCGGADSRGFEDLKSGTHNLSS